MRSTITRSIGPQAGPQVMFMSTPADIAFYGGAAGGGKTFALLLEPIRHINNPDFGAVIFRRESVQITNEGGLWDCALDIYPYLGGMPKNQPKSMFRFTSGSRVTFAHLNREMDVLGYQGAQIPLIGFDELTHFTRYQFFYMLSRNRSTCGVRPYIRATTNPDADSWVAEFISWWIDSETGYAIPERSGVIRYFCRINDDIYWGNTRQELADQFFIPPGDIKSFTFICAKIEDNPALMRADPGYIANLKALPRVERERLLQGNWKIRPSAGMYFPRESVEIIDVLPEGVTRMCRGWDLASTVPTPEYPDPDWTATVKIGRMKDGRFVVMDARRFRKKSGDVRLMVKNIASQEGYRTKIELPQDPGQAGKEQAASYVKMLSGLSVSTKPVTGSKITRAESFASQWQAGNVVLLRGPWNEEYLSEMENFPEGSHDDYTDASSTAFNNVAGGRYVDYEKLCTM